jgi:aminopeptidase N
MVMFRKLLLFLIVNLFLQITVFADYYPRDWNVDVKHYSFSLNLSDDSNLISGQATIEIHFKEEVKQLFLDLIGRNENGKGMTVSAVNIQGRESSYLHNKNRLKITPETAFHKNESVQIEIVYEGIPADGLIISNNKFGDRSFFGDNWPDRARHWLPTVDHPSDKAGVDFIVEAPEKYEVIANGIKLETRHTENGFKLTHWHEDVDISTKIMVIGVAQFSIELSGEVDNVPVEAWVYPQNREEGFHDYAKAVEVLDYFESHIGDYPYKKLANVQSKTRYGGMENASNIFYSENSVTGKGTIEGLIAHEIAHQWFGNSASEKDWHHVWLSEGFATYFAHLYMEHTYGVDLLRQRMSGDRDKIIDYYNREKVPIVNTAISDYRKLLNTNSYQKGGWVLHMLRNMIGDKAFWDGIQSYYAKYRDGNALTEDFRKEMEIASSKDLEVFFNQWIYQAGQPELQLSYSYDIPSKKLNITVEQLQTNTKFIFPLEIQGEFKNGQSEVFVANVSEVKQSFSFDCMESPNEILIDPNIKLLYTLEDAIKTK